MFFLDFSHITPSAGSSVECMCVYTHPSFYPVHQSAPFGTKWVISYFEVAYRREGHTLVYFFTHLLRCFVFFAFQPLNARRAQLSLALVDCCSAQVFVYSRRSCFLLPPNNYCDKNPRPCDFTGIWTHVLGVGRLRGCLSNHRGNGP